jgi:hypothetical protein
VVAVRMYTTSRCGYCVLLELVAWPDDAFGA